jgi:hypothetical protein
MKVSKEADTETLTAACFQLSIRTSLRAQQPSIYYVQNESHLRPSLRLPTDDAATRRCQPGLWARLDCHDPGVWFFGSIAHVKLVNWRLKLITSRVREAMPMRRSPKHGNATALIRRSRCFKIVWHNPDEVWSLAVSKHVAKAGTAML